jgi:hypothetical protein
MDKAFSGFALLALRLFLFFKPKTSFMSQFYARLSMLLLAVCFSSFLLGQDFQELFQGFEGTSNDTWNYVSNPASYDIDGDAWTVSGPTSEILPSTGGFFWYMRDLNNPNGGFDGFHTLDFENVDVSSFPYNTVTFKYYTIAYEAGDSIGYIIETDAGADFDMDNYVDLDRNTEGWTTVFVNLPAGVSNARLRLMAKQNGGDDFAGFDDVFLTSSDIDLIPPTVLGVEVLSSNSVRLTYNEPMDPMSVEDASNYTSSVTIDNIVYTDPGDGTSYVDITFANVLSNGLVNTLVAGFVNDISGNFYLEAEVFEFIYNNALPELVITEIMYNPSIDEETEFVEIYNASDVVVPVGGLRLNVGSNVFLMPAIDLAAGGFILVSRDEALAEAFYGMDFYDWGNSALTNSTDDITIVNFSGQLIDSVTYNDSAPWPTEADGDGPSLELIAPGLDNSLAESWQATTTQFMDTEVFATPGSIPEILAPVVSFEDDVISVQEGSGAQTYNLLIFNGNDQAAEVTVSAAAASTAVAGVDYNLLTTDITFPVNDMSAQAISLELLDNDVQGGKYLILELNSVANSTINEGTRLILLINDNDLSTPTVPLSPAVSLNHIGSFNVGAVAEIVAYDPISQRLFTSNSEDNQLEIVDFSDPANPSSITSVGLNVFGGGINSVDVNNGVVAVAVEGNDTGVAGKVLFFDTNGTFINSVEVGFLPDMLLFSPDGTRLLTANEGEPNDDYTVDPVGSVSIIDLTPGINNLSNTDVTTVDLSVFNGQEAALTEAGVRLFGPGASVAQDLEPEYIAISQDGTTAFASCQENNAVILIDIASGTATDILPLGYKDWSAEGIVLDASNESPDVFFANWPILGMYQPDAVTTFSVGGQEYLITANEGDARDYDGFTEEFRVGDEEIQLDPDAFPHAAYLKEDVLLGRLRITAANGDTDGDGDYDELYAYGGRSFSIWNASTGELVYDSGSELELITAADPVFGAIFNTTDDENEFKNRSDDKGPEPEAVTVGMVNGKPYGFIALERIGGIMVYDLSDPTTPQFIQYINTRTVATEGGDLAPEDVIFIPAEDSPNGTNMLVASYEVSGTLAAFEIQSASTVSFATESAIVEEGSGLVSFPIIVEQVGALTGTATIDVIAASTAADGEDYVLTSTTINFEANDNTDQLIELDILDNTDLGGRYLILEINQEASTVGIGENGRFILLIQDNDDIAPVASSDPYVQLNHLGSFDLGGDSVAEIVAYDGESKRLFVTNSENNTIEAINYSDPANLTVDFTLFLELVGNSVNSVAVSNGIVAVAVEGDNTEDNGFVVFFDTEGNDLGIIPVGVLPDMVTFTPDGNTVLTANEGEPNDDYTIDPEGSVSIIDISNGVANATVNTIGFADFNSQQANLIEQGVRIFGPGATVAQDLEPEYITVSDDGAFAYVVCQENNALAIVDLSAQMVSNILPLGFKDWTAEGVTMDASDRSGDIFFANWPINGIYQPDAIDYFSTGGAGYLITANEGDARDYDGYSEEFRVKDDEIQLDPDAFPNAEYLKEDALLGRLKITAANGDTDGDGDYDELYAYGGRSFSIWNATTGELVYDSGNDIEQITAADPVYGAIFNTTDDENEFKNRSDDKGPEPEAVITAEIDGGQYAFIALERVGGVMVYNVTDPAAPVFLQYINTRSVDDVGGDLAPEGIAFIPADASPSGKPLLSVSYEVSGSIAMFELELNCPIVSIPDEVNVCEGDVAFLEVSGIYNDILWSTGDTTSSIIVETVDTLTVIATTESGCMAFDTVAVSFVPLPTIDLGADVMACENEDVVLDAGDEFDIYLWSNGAETSSITVFMPDTYGVTVTDENGCEASDEIEVTFDPLPEVNFPADTTACVEDILVYDPGEGSVIVVGDQELEQFTTEGLDVGTYEVDAVIVNEFGCELAITFSFTLEVCSSTDEVAVAERISIYPNPTTGWASLQMEQLISRELTLDITTPSGQLIQRHQLEKLGVNHVQEIDLSNVSAGIYFIRLYNAEGTQVRRLIVE